MFFTLSQHKIQFFSQNNFVVCKCFEFGLGLKFCHLVKSYCLYHFQLLDASQVNVTNWVCNSTQLAKLIEMPENATTDVDYISGQFCSLDSDTVSKILEEVILLVDVGDLMEEVMGF